MKSKFLTHLDCVDSDNEGVWILNCPLIYYSEFLNCTITVPGGFNTDLASVPRIPIVFMLFGNRSHHEAVIHDYLYRKDSNPIVAFSTANSIFLEAMEARKKPWYICKPMYYGVCVGGKSSYHKKNVLDKL